MSKNSKKSGKIVLVSIGVLLAAGAAVAGAIRWEGASEQKERTEKFAMARMEAAHHGEGFEFAVPRPGDRNYDDYREMLAHPRYRSSLENTPGYAMPYDPEWRSVLTGRRKAEPTNLEFVTGTGSVENSLERLFAAFEARSTRELGPYQISEDEFELILWPEFPQSRPFAKVPVQEAWLFRLGKYRESIRDGMNQYAGKTLHLESFEIVKKEEYTNFNLLVVSIRAREEGSKEAVELEIQPVLAERNGRYSFFSYNT